MPHSRARCSDAQFVRRHQNQLKKHRRQKNAANAASAAALPITVITDPSANPKGPKRRNGNSGTEYLTASARNCVSAWHRWQFDEQELWDVVPLVKQDANYF